VNTTVRGASPLARAVRTKSLLSTASMEPRVMRASGASEKIAIEMAGSASCRRLAQNASPLRVSRLSIR
jgi:hypothetical protein